MSLTLTEKVDINTSRCLYGLPRVNHARFDKDTYFQKGIKRTHIKRTHNITNSNNVCSLLFSIWNSCSTGFQNLKNFFLDCYLIGVRNRFIKRISRLLISLNNAMKV